jgi:hypothetical protein
VNILPSDALATDFLKIIIKDIANKYIVTKIILPNIIFFGNYFSVINIEGSSLHR